MHMRSFFLARVSSAIHTHLVHRPSQVPAYIQVHEVCRPYLPYQDLTSERAGKSVRENLHGCEKSPFSSEWIRLTDFFSHQHTRTQPSHRTSITQARITARGDGMTKAYVQQVS